MRMTATSARRRSDLDAPDFDIGAHAAVSGLYLLTRDARRYAGYFLRVRMISPNLSASYSASRASKARLRATPQR
jgi:predicted nucleic acid-binding protein